MAKVFLGNSFSLQMLGPQTESANIRVHKICACCASEVLKGGFESTVGHQDTANIFSDILGVYVPWMRSVITLQPGDTLIVGQLSGGRLPEGATHLPPGFRIIWYKVEVVEGA